MNTLLLEDQWETIEVIQETGISYVRIDGKCIPELCLAVNSLNNRCLMLRLPADYITTFTGEDKENIKTSFSKKGNYILLELLDSYYNSLFNDLIISLYFKIKDISNSNESTNLFISTINKWASFLENSKSSKLSKDIIKGLFGELVVLKVYLGESNTDHVNDILKSWTGPYDANTDFVFEDLNVEVKSKNTNSSVIKISSEFQLDDEAGKSLNLAVVSLDSDHESKGTIGLLHNEIRDLILELNGDLSILGDALAQKNLFPSNLKDYDDYTFQPVYMEVFDCDAVNEEKRFPRIKKSELPEELKKVRYDMNLNSLNMFIIEKIDF
jgi:hypothetical protein